MRVAVRLGVAAACGLAVAGGLRAGWATGPAAAGEAAPQAQRGFAAEQGIAGAEGAPGGSGSAAGRGGPRASEAQGGGAPGLLPDRTAETAEGGALAGADATGFASSGSRKVPGQRPGEDRERPGGSSGVIRLDGLAAAPGAVSAALRGFDPAGPRALVLWWVSDGRASRLADGFSDSSGELHFPQVAAPGDAMALVVSPAGAPPPSQDTSDPALVAGRAPLPPVVEEVRPDASGVVLRVGAREASGAVLVAPGDGDLLGRFALPPPSAPASRTLEIAVDGSVSGSGLWVAQELPDGRRSPFEPVALPPAAKGTGAVP